VPAGWQSALTQGKSFTGFLGLLFAGWCCDRYGYRVTVLLGLFLNVGGIFIIFFGKRKSNSCSR
jgi:SP family general alpha glucoside:H+ symporter-like MFS transporter